MNTPVKLGAVLALSLVLLAGCTPFIPSAPPAVEPVSGTENETPAPVSPPTNAGASTGGYWSGYWTWRTDLVPPAWKWTWVWYDTGGNSYTTS